MKNNNWKTIGTVLGETNINSYLFMLQSFKAKKNDMVTTQTSIPDGNGKIIKVNVWGKIASINCSNEWFPRQAAQEMAFQNINIEDTPLPTSRDELICKVNILGYTKQDDKSPKLLPMVYPVKPANAVSYPNSNDVEKLLISDLNSKHPIHIGTLMARDNVEIKIDADSLVSRHVLVTGMSGSGKTVMVRRIISELMRLHFPMLVYDIHGDYLGFVKKQNIFPKNKIKLFYPSLSVKAEDKEIIYTLINKLGKPLTEPQNDYLNTLLNKVKFDESSIIKFLNSLISFSKGLLDTKNLKSKGSNTMPHIKPATMFVVNRSLNQVVKKLVNMENTNARHRQRMSKFYDFEKLPDANTEPEKIISKGQLSILYLRGYETLPASAIVSILSETLFKHRQEVEQQIPPFLSILEEGHTLIPSRSENKDNLPTVDTFRKFASEGRKFSCGIMIISQRPSRLDETIASQCNSHFSFRKKNQKDQRFVRETSEHYDAEDVNQLPSLANGQGIIGGQVVNFPLAVQVKFDDNLLNDEIGDEDFITAVENWDDKESVKLRKKFAKDFSKISKSAQKRLN